MKRQIRFLLGLMAVLFTSFAYPSGDKKEFEEGKKYPLLSQLYGYKEYTNAPTPSLKSVALKKLRNDVLYEIDNLNTAQERKDLLQETENFLRENKDVLEKQQFDEHIKSLQEAKRTIERDRKRHEKRRQMPAALKKAIEDGDANAAFAHLNKNPLDIDSMCEVGDNPLMEALKQERWNVDMIKQLIKRTKNIAFRNDEKETALHLAAFSIDPRAAEIVKQLINRGAAIEARSDSGYTPLAFAIMIGSNVPVADVLLRHKASLKNALAKEPISIGFSNASLDQESKDHEQQKIAFLAWLIKHGLDVNRASVYGGYSLLHQAIMRYNEPAVKLLLDNKADIEAKDGNGRTPLQQAWNNYHLKKWNWDERSDAQRDHDNKQILSIIELLLQRGAKKEALGTDTWSPLMIAILHGQLQIIKILIKHGADIQEKKNNETPIELARRLLNQAKNKEEKENYERIVDYLVQNSPEHKHSKEYKEKVESAAVLAQHTALPRDVADLVGEFTTGPTHPSKITLNEIKRYLMGEEHSLEMGKYDPRLNALINKDITVLELADEAGDTPLLLAIKYNKPDAVATILTVLESADEKIKHELLPTALNHKNEQGFDAYHLAKELGHKDIIDLLAPYHKE